MLEPLIVLTVLNCIFMFSSTVTTCALWWQYRSHRCCFKKDSMQQNVRHNSIKGKSNSNSWKKSTSLKQNNLVNSMDREKSSTNPARDNKCKRNCKTRPRSSGKYILQMKTMPDEQISSMEMTDNAAELEEKRRSSVPSQADGKSAVVMEYSTVQKIVQILDNDTDLAATKLIIKELNSKQNNDDKKDSMVEASYEPPATSEDATETIE